MSIPQSFIQAVLSRADIVEIIEQHLTLKKSGANYFASCPFHHEKSASFSVSPSKQFYYCFGCGASGNAVTFLMEHSGLSFVDAIQELATRVGLPMPAPDLNTSSTFAKQTESQGLHQLLDAAARYYQHQLQHTPTARQYLTQRGLSDETIAHFGIGYAPSDWQALAKVHTPYSDKKLLDTGLVIQNDEGRRYDRFRHRITFPILDRRGRTIGFGGRTIDHSEPKYLNSPETPLFEKGRELYGFSHAQKAIRDAGYVLVVEGYMDVVMLAQHGQTNAVATLGTATSTHHLQTLLRTTHHIIFCFDGDKAGRNAARRALQTALPLLRDNTQASFLFLQDNHDPDSFIRSEGLAAFQQATASAIPLTTFLLDDLSVDIALDTPEGRSRLAHDAKSAVLQIQAPLLRLQTLKALAKKCGLQQAELEHIYGLARSRSQGARRQTTTLPPSRANKPSNTAISTLLQLILQQPAWATRLSPDLIPDDEAAGKALIAIIDAFSIGDLDGQCDLGTLIEHFRPTAHDQTLNQYSAQLMVADFDEQILETLFEDTVKKLQQQHIDAEIQNLTQTERQHGLPENAQRRLAALLLQKRRLQS